MSHLAKEPDDVDVTLDFFRHRHDMGRLTLEKKQKKTRNAKDYLWTIEKGRVVTTAPLFDTPSETRHNSHPS